MDAVIAQFAVSKVPEPVPIVVNQVLMIRLHRGRADPQVPIEPGGRFLRLLEADRVAVSGEEKIGLVNIPDFAGVDQLDGLAEAAPPAPLRPAGRDPLVLAGGLDEPGAFPHVVRNGLFHVDVFAGLHGPDRGQCVPMVGGGDGDRIDVLVLEDTAHVGLDLRLFPGLLKNSGSRRFGAAAVDIDNGGDFDVGDRGDFADMRGAPGTNTDNAKANAIARAGPGLGCGGRSPDEEMTAIHTLPVYFVVGQPGLAAPRAYNGTL